MSIFDRPIDIATEGEPGEWDHDSMAVVAPPSLDDAWEGIMLTYTEQDFPTSALYPRQVPGWQCRTCGQKYGTSGLPPNPCKCGATWSKTVRVG